MKKWITLLVLISYTTAYCDCAQPVTHLNQGDIAQCEGYLFTKDQELKVRLTNNDYNFLKQEVDLQTKQLDLYKLNVQLYDDNIQKESQKSELWRVKAEESSKKVTELENGRWLRDGAMIALGIALTCLGAWALGQGYKR